MSCYQETHLKRTQTKSSSFFVESSKYFFACYPKLLFLTEWTYSIIIILSTITSGVIFQLLPKTFNNIEILLWNGPASMHRRMHWDKEWKKNRRHSLKKYFSTRDSSVSLPMLFHFCDGCFVESACVLLN